MQEAWVMEELVPVGAEVRWLCRVSHPGTEVTAYAALSGRDLALNQSSAAVEALKTARIEQAKQAILERA